MKKSFFVIIILSFVVASCSPSTEAIEKALAETQTAMPSETAPPIRTPISLSEIDIEAILILPNDLPAGYSGGQAHEVTSEQFNWMSNKGVNNMYQEIAFKNEQVGGVTVFVYDVTNDALVAYQELVESLGDNYEKLNDIGDDGVYSTFETEIAGILLKNPYIVFRRCNATVNLVVSGTSDIMGISSYAKRLDERLQSLVCK